MLIEKGARVNVRDSYGFTPLDRAIMFGKIVEIIEIETRFLNTHSFPGDTNLARILIDSDALINVKDMNGMTPLHHASVGGIYLYYISSKTLFLFKFIYIYI